jgi:DNA invertase Pin-like site-specific DNA recombinase
LTPTGGVERTSLPAWVKPQLAALAKNAQAGPDWLHEIKLDGYRMHARLDAGRVMRELRPGDIVTVWKLDRLGRTLRQVLNTIDRIRDRGARLCILTQELDTSTSKRECMRR